MTEQPLTLREASGIVDKQTTSLRAAIPQTWFFLLIWGLAWAVGYTALAQTRLSTTGFIIHGVALGTAVIIGWIYLARTLRGVSTTKNRYVNWWSMSWMVGFTIHGVMVSALVDTMKNLAPTDAEQLFWVIGNMTPLTIVTLCLMGSAALFQENLIGIIGVFIGVIAIVSGLLPPVAGCYLCAGAGVAMATIGVILALQNLAKDKTTG